ncbi:MAG TPA: low temperature requirement protein A [Acidimicrobiales bacterium]|nr:low temperature requirement protein A [Acidimicrobiales bacterium]
MTRTEAEDRAAAEEPRVTPLELFFDLVFVFGFTQITGGVAEDPTWTSLGQGVLMFAVLWWAWGAYAWLTNAVRTRELAPRLVVLAAMAAMLVTALAVPGAFEDNGVAFGLGYLVVMALHAVLFGLAGENPDSTRAAILRLAPTNLAAAGLLVAAGTADGAARTALWLVAIGLSYAGPYITGVAGFTVHPGHFVERHGLIVIVALGESVVAIGAGSDELAVDWDLAGLTLVAIALLSGLWWAYFDVDASAGERALLASTGPDRARLARDVYSYLHIPLVFGVVLTAMGLHDALVHPAEPLEGVLAAAFGAGVAAFFGALAAIRLRRGDRPGAPYVVAALVGASVAVAATQIDAVISLAILAAITVGTTLVERRTRRSPTPDARHPA